METSRERQSWAIVSSHSPATKTYWSQWKQLYIRDGILARQFYLLDNTQFYQQVVLPHVLQPDMRRQQHEGPVGHFVVKHSVARLQSRYYRIR